MKDKIEVLFPVLKVTAVMLAFIAAMSFISLPFQVIYGFYMGVKSAYSGVKFTQELLMQDKLFMNVMMLFQEISMIAVVICAWKAFEKKPLAEMGFPQIKGNTKKFIVGLIFGMVSITLVFAIILFTKNAQLVNSISAPQFNAEILFSLFVYILVGFAEELLSRGYSMSIFKQKYNIYLTVAISALMFSALHLGNANASVLGLINIALVGVLFSYMFIKSGNIYMPIGYHITWNFFQGCVWGMNVSGNENASLYSIKIVENNIINGGAFGAEGGLAATAVILLGLLFVKFYYKDSEYKFDCKQS